MAGSEGSGERRLVLLGMTGQGRSSSGNTILGRKAFRSEASPRSVTKRSALERGEVDGRPVLVVDTPGFFDTDLSELEVKQEVLRCVALSAPGPHAFLLVIRVGRRKRTERRVVDTVLQLFGEQALRYTVVLLTRGEELAGKPPAQFVQEDPHLAELVGRCGGGCHLFRNKEPGDRAQVSELLDKVDAMVARGGGCFTNDMYQGTEAALRQEQEAVLREQGQGPGQDPDAARKEAVERLMRKRVNVLIGVSLGVLLGALLGVVFLLPAAAAGPSPVLIAGCAVGAFSMAVKGGRAAKSAEGSREAAKLAVKALFSDVMDKLQAFKPDES
ncbi:GTPase IMAP family member 7-like [Lepisosteus oculatus]|uniref:GTPase IMAP family member 7-like n=1 Tax=Lepisosteus oculatus TaxID=7918 RepID=UPI0035F516CA